MATRRNKAEAEGLIAEYETTSNDTGALLGWALKAILFLLVRYIDGE